MNLNLQPFLFLIPALLCLFFILFLVISKKSNSRRVRDLMENMNLMAASLKTRISELEGERSKVSAILKSMAEGVIAVDTTKKILLINPAAETIFNVQEGRFLNRSLLEIVRDETLDRMMDQAIKKQEVVSQEIEVHHPTHKILKVNAAGVPQNEGAVSGVLVLYDITEIRRLERLRQEFVANVSHELRTPLTSIKGFIETLLGGALRDSTRSEGFLKMMEEDTERLNRLIDDLLELSKLESKEIALKLAPFDLASEIKKLIAVFEPRIREKKIVVVDQLSSNHVPEALADSDQLKQVLINLIDNAIKFNRENGKIIFSAKASSNGKITVSIEDTGAGIPKEAVSRIFERFFRVDKARSRELGGTGLGLSIVKHIIEAHGGEVWCESEIGKGSKFSFTLRSVEKGDRHMVD
jgi:two-component system phosphate regulon sensor histidine kinase PhoR